ncbi:MAG: inositol oxygenase [Candidatus Azotimanducaceae bacterium]|jgi:inositol oxygenase
MQDTKTPADSFRNYDDHQTDHVAEFYRDNHRFQTLAFAQQKLEQYRPLNHASMSAWEAISKLDSISDDSDPDTELSQLDHLLQTAEAMRADNQPRWLQLTGLIHDLGKVLCLFGEPQWAVVGDTFPLGCRFSEDIIYHDYFTANPDYLLADYQTEIGIYARHCGLDQVTMSWGHDEYLFQVMKAFLPPEALFVVRYHSFYSAHQAGGYRYLMTQEDHKMMEWVRRFQPYDLYSKNDLPPDRSELMHYYQGLVAEYLPATLKW